MEVLYVCHRFPYPPKRGGKIRPFNMIRHLSRRHRVTVASLVRSPAEAEEGRGLNDYTVKTLVGHVSKPVQTARMVARLPTATPSSMGYFYSRELDAQIQRAVAGTRFDLIFVHCSSVAQYVSNITGVPKIIDFGDMDSQKWLIYSKVKAWPLNIGYFIEGFKLERAERRLAHEFDFATCTTQLELETLRSYRAAAETDWFPNGVDAEFFKPDDTPYDENLLSFVGRMDYYPNQQCMFDFCDRVFPAIVRKRPATKLVIIGANPSNAVRKLAERPGISVTGSVPDVRPYVRKSAAMVAPLTIARGTQNKILEAMAMGVPTVTSVIAAGGVDAVPDEHLLTASTPEEYTKAITDLLGDREKRQRFAERGRERMLSHHDWSSSMTRLDAIIERCLERCHGDRRVGAEASAIPSISA